MKKSLLTMLFALVCAGSMSAIPSVAVNGKLPGAFSVSSTKVVYFSQGNLQYTKSTGTWSFMEEQYSTVETHSQDVGDDYATQDVVSLFGWGTSGWDNTAADATSLHYQPYSTSAVYFGTADNNYQYGPSNANVVGSSTAASAESWSKEVAGNHPYENYDWGVYNSSDLGSGWRTLTTQEWGYLLNSRSGNRYAKARVHGMDGMIILPDGWTQGGSRISAALSGINAYSTWNSISNDDWAILEDEGCVFLPAAGFRSFPGTSVSYVGTSGRYWSSSARDESGAYCVYINPNSMYPQWDDLRTYGYSVRLVSETAPTITETPLTFEAVEAGAVVTYTMNSTRPVQYSLNGGAWTNYSSAITLSNVGDKVSFRGNNTNYNNSDPKFQCSADCYIYGNIMSLVNATNFATATTLTANKTFFNMFLNNTQIKNHPSKDLILPATTLSENCYSFMFDGCTGLTSAPALPATTLTKSCYYCMFRGCTGLTGAPALPATTLADYCYYYMFRDCTGLISAPELPVTTLANFCYAYMFMGCTGLTNAPALPATTLANNCYYSMFEGCTNLTSAPELPATTLATNCYYCMFNGCTSLTSAPELPATTLATACYQCMFYGCTDLTSAPELPATTLVTNCYYQMFFGCTGLTSAPELPATTLVTNCYLQMFYGCTNLSSVTCYATSGSTNYATTGWLGNVAASGTFYAPKNSVFASEARGTGSIPEGWTFSPFQASLTTAPTAVSGLEYTGSAQALINNDGVAVDGTLNYSLDNTNWSDAIPTATNAGDYTVYYMVVGDASHADYTPSPNTVAATIAKVDPTTTAPSSKGDLVYTAADQELVNAGSGTGGEWQYKVNSGDYSNALPTGKNVGEYTVYYKFVGDANHNNIDEASFTMQITPTVVAITANADPEHPEIYYSTFYYQTQRYALPNDGTKAFVAELIGTDLLMHEIASGEDVIPEDVAVILQSPVSTINMTLTDADPVTVTDPNCLLGTDGAKAAPANCYVISGHSTDNNVVGVGFYQFSGTLKAHKAFTTYPGGYGAAPKRMRFVFNTTTGMDQITNDKSPITNKVIEDGVLYIIKNGVKYNAQGQIVK